MKNVHVDAIRDDLETLVLDADLLEAVLGSPDPGKKSKEIEIKVSQRLRRHMHDPRFKALSERLEALKERHEQGLLTSVEFLKTLLELAAMWWQRSKRRSPSSKKNWARRLSPTCSRPSRTPTPHHGRAGRQGH